MIKTISLCPTCYKKIEATISFIDGQAIMHKECDKHGKFSAIVDKDAQHVSNFYRYGSLGKNSNMIIHIYDECNMNCKWCYYDGDGSCNNVSFEYFDTLLRPAFMPIGFNLMLSGGEPTLRPDYFEFVKKAVSAGWGVSTITNMLKLGYGKFFEQTLNEGNFIYGIDGYRFAMSMQHPKNYSDEIYKIKLQALEHLKATGLRADCVVFSIQDLSELYFIKEFYDKTKTLYKMLRIRTMFNNWKNKGEQTIYLSELHRAFTDKFAEYTPKTCERSEISNIYCLYMETNEGREISISSSPNVHNVDYNICHRPVYMLANDGNDYSVPVAQIINEGISKGWKDGFKLEK